MKRRKEIEIMLTTFSQYGICETPELKKAVEQGLKQIRIEKFQERRYAKARKTDSSVNAGLRTKQNKKRGGLNHGKP